jgi:L-iditol 2-dehydrogenase
MDRPPRSCRPGRLDTAISARKAGVLMKAAALFGARDLRLIEADEPVLGPGLVRIAVGRVGICGSDIHFWEDGRVGAFSLDGPQILGHEAAGTVVEVGHGVTTLAPGDRVAIEPGLACGHCPECLQGTYNLCPHIAFMGMPPTPGSLSERVVIPARFAHRLPDALSLDAGALLEPLSVALWSCTRAEIRLGDRVLIAGAGPIGTLVARVALASGAVEVVVVDVDSARLASLPTEPGLRGVSVADGWEPVPDEFDRYLECSGAPKALADGLSHLRRRGWAVLVGVPPTPEIAIPSVLPRFRELTITTVHRYAHSWPTAAALVAGDRVRIDDLVGRHFALDEVGAAFEAAAARSVGLKAMIDIAGDPTPRKAVDR